MISVCVMVSEKDENLERDLSFLSLLADQVIIETVSDNAPQTRARMFDRATQDWVLFLDLSYRLPFAQIQLMCEFLKDVDSIEKIEAIRLTRRCLTNQTNVSGFQACRGEFPSEERSYRGYCEEKTVSIFRNKPKLKWAASLCDLIDSSFQENVIDSPIVFYQDPSRVSQDWKFYFDKGVEAIGQHRLTEAAAYLKRALDRNPESPVIQSNLGYVLVELGSFQEAHDLLEKSVLTHPTHGDSHLNLGVLFMRLSRYSEAISRFLQLIRVAPDSFLGFRNMGLCYAKMNNLQRAVDCFRKSLELYPDYIDAKIELGVVYFMLGKVELARMLMNECLKREPSNARVRMILAQMETSLQESLSHQESSLDSKHGPS